MIKKKRIHCCVTCLLFSMLLPFIVRLRRNKFIDMTFVKKSRIGVYKITSIFFKKDEFRRNLFCLIHVYINSAMNF